MKPFPKLLFKFKSIPQNNDLSRIGEVFTEHKLFFPKREKLNDPFEGMVKPCYVSGWAGSSIRLAADEEYSMLMTERDQYRVLALSETCFSPLMWVHYADECKGICLCFHADQSFNRARPVTYFHNRGAEVQAESQDVNYHQDVYNGFFVKHADWQYEKEWRIVEKTENKYFPFKKEELAAVIYGHKIDPGNKRIIQRMLPSEVKQYAIHIGGQTGTIRLLPEEYSIDYSGRAPNFIDTVDALYKSILDNNSMDTVNA